MKYENNDVAIAKCITKRETNAVLRGLKLINASTLINSDDIVLIVPNWVNKTKPDPKCGIVVGTDTLRTVIKWVKRRKPKRIVVACGSGGGDTLDVMKNVGYDKIIEEEVVEFIDFNNGPYVDIKLKHDNPSRIKVNKIYQEMTKLISFTQLKIHEEATMSSCIKNIVMSLPTTEEHGTPKKDKGIHNDLHGFIRAMAETIRIDISIVSLNPTMVSTGPTMGISKHTGLVIVGNNPISTDTICARILGFKPQGVRYLYELEKVGIKETDVNKINVVGISLVKAEQVFTNKVYGKKNSFD